MKRDMSFTLIILPTDLVLREFLVNKDLLSQADLDLKFLARYVIEQWFQGESNWGNLSRPDELSAYEIILNYIYLDFLTNGPLERLDRQDKVAVKVIVKEFCRELFNEIVPLLEKLNFQESQLGRISVDNWDGLSMIIKVPNQD